MLCDTEAPLGGAGGEFSPPAAFVWSSPTGARDPASEMATVVTEPSLSCFTLFRELIIFLTKKLARATHTDNTISVTPTEVSIEPCKSELRASRASLVSVDSSSCAVVVELPDVGSGDDDLSG